MPVLLHIGTHKTGTTSIQYWARDHEHLLAARGYRFPRGWLRLNTHLELPLVLLRQDRMMNGRRHGDEWRDTEWRVDVLEQIADDLARHPNVMTILSAEDLSLLRHDDEFGPLRDLVGDARVVVYLREPVEYLRSLAHYNAKRGTPESSDPAAYNYTRLDSWLVDYPALVTRWQRWFSCVDVFDYDEVTQRDGSVIPSFLRHLDVPLVDVNRYRMNRREDAVPHVDGNRASGLRFGQ